MVNRIRVMMALGKALREAKVQDVELVLEERQIKPLAREWAEKTGWATDDCERAFRLGGGIFNGLAVR